MHIWYTCLCKCTSSALQTLLLCRFPVTLDSALACSVAAASPGGSIACRFLLSSFLRPDTRASRQSSGREVVRTCADEEMVLTARAADCKASLGVEEA